MELQKLNKDEFLSEISHYKVKNNEKLSPNFNDTIEITNLSTGENVGIGSRYIQQYCISAEQYDEIIKVGKEDKYWTKGQVNTWISNYLQSHAVDNNFVALEEFANEVPRVGDLKLEGIRSVFQNIRDQTAFTVWFYKVDNKKTKKAYNEEVEARVQSFLEPVLKAKASKKSMEDAVRAGVKELIENPVLDYIPGELRKMICYKKDFSSRDGNYKVFDLEKQSIGSVNIKTIQSIVINGKKYELE